MCASIMDRAHKDPWATVTFLLFVTYAVYYGLLFTVDVVPMDINNVSWGNTILQLKSYFGGTMLFQLAILLFQVAVLPEGKELPRWIKYFYHIYIAANMCLQCYTVGNYAGRVYALKTATASNVVTNFAQNYSMIESYSRNLAFNAVADASDSISDHPGIISGNAYYYLKENKKSIDEFQKKYKCCGYMSADEWVTKYSGVLTTGQKLLPSSYVWWHEDGESLKAPASCCVKGSGPLCEIASKGCLPRLLEGANMDITYISVVVAILAVIAVSRDIALVKMIRTIDLEPFPKIVDDDSNDRHPAGSDASKLASMISVNIGRVTESSA